PLLSDADRSPRNPQDIRGYLLRSLRSAGYFSAASFPRCLVHYPCKPYIHTPFHSAISCRRPPVFSRIPSVRPVSQQGAFPPACSDPGGTLFRQLSRNILSQLSRKI